MACLSPTAADNHLEDRAGSIGMFALRGWRPFLRRLAEGLDRRGATRLDDRSLRDLGLHRDLIEQQDRRDLGTLWLSRPAL